MWVHGMGFVNAWFDLGPISNFVKEEASYLRRSVHLLPSPNAKLLIFYLNFLWEAMLTLIGKLIIKKIHVPTWGGVVIYVHSFIFIFYL